MKTATEGAAVTTKQIDPEVIATLEWMYSCSSSRTLTLKEVHGWGDEMESLTQEDLDTFYKELDEKKRCACCGRHAGKFWFTPNGLCESCEMD